MATSPPTNTTGKFAVDLEAHVVSNFKKTHAKRKKQYAVYIIECSFAAAQWSTQRRFSEFVKLNSNLKSAFPTLNFLQLPTRLKKSLDANFLEKRRQKLNSYIIDVLDQVPLIVPVLKCELIMQFLDVMKNLERHFIMDKRTRGREVFPDLYASFPFNKKAIHLTLQHGMDKGEDIPIHIAAKEGICEDISAIIKSAPQAVGITDNMGQTALHIASRHGQAPVVRLLLVFGANRNIQDRRGWSPLHCACTSADIQTVITLLEDESVIPDLQNVDGNTPLHYFARNFSAIQEIEMLKSVLTLFTSKGTDINSQNKSGETPLHHACWKGSLPLVSILISSGAELNLLTSSGESALQWAAREGRDNIVQLLIQHGARSENRNGGDLSMWVSSRDRKAAPSPNQGSSVEDDEDEFDEDDGSESEDELNDRHKISKSRAQFESDSSAASSPNSSSPQLTPPTKFVFGSFSRNVPPTTFLPVLASPKRLIKSTEPELSLSLSPLSPPLTPQLSSQSTNENTPLPSTDTSTTPAITPSTTPPPHENGTQPSYSSSAPPTTSSNEVPPATLSPHSAPAVSARPSSNTPPPPPATLSLSPEKPTPVIDQTETNTPQQPVAVQVSIPVSEPSHPEGGFATRSRPPPARSKKSRTAATLRNMKSEQAEKKQSSEDSELANVVSERLQLAEASPSEDVASPASG